MKKEKFYANRAHVDHWRPLVDAGSYLNKIEIQFWQILTTWMLESRILQHAIRFTFFVVEKKPWYWLLGVTVIVSVCAYILGFILGVLW
jgi:hypothetical protein